MLKLHILPESVHAWHPFTLIATGFGSGLIRPASGTFGSLLFFALILPVWVLMPVWVHICIFLFLLTLGTASVKYILYRCDKDKLDPSWVVIDEWAGLGAALIGAYTLPSMLVGLVLFRVFDVLKPWPIAWLDRNIGGALGVMLDDVAAGLASLLILMGLRFYGVL